MPKPTGYDETEKRKEWDKLSMEEKCKYGNLDKVTNTYRDQKVVHKSIFAAFTQRTYATSPASLQVLFKTFNGRDKLIRLVQYGMRFLRGVSQVLGTKFPDVLQQILSRTTADRRTFRWLNFFPTLVNLQAIFYGDEHCPWGVQLHKRILYASTKILLLVWETLDKIRWLCETRVLDFEKRFYWMRVSFGLFTVACGLTAAHHAEESFLKTHDDPAKEIRSRKLFYKFLMHVFTFGHVSSAIPSHDIICGILGMSTAGMDVLDLWPTKK